jgi:hypothetical protein
MGVTVHFEGRATDAQSRDTVIAIAKQFAAKNDWPYEEFAETQVTLERVIDEQPVDYVGPTVGIELRPHEASEPLRLEFDEDNFCQEYCKTQFAPIETHVKVVELLRLVEPYFQKLAVVDEGEYFESGDLERLRVHLTGCFRMMEKLIAEKSNRKGPIRLPSGRIIDLQG